MKKSFLAGIFIALAGIGLISDNASALLIVEGGISGVIPSDSETNDLLGNTAPLSGLYGAQIKLDGKAKVRFEFLGEEAGWNNYFQIEGTTIFTNDGSAWGASSGNYLFDAGYIPFSFLANAGDKGGVANGTNPDNNLSNLPNFFVSILTEPLTPTTGLLANTTLDPGIYLWFDDTGAGDDDNHDDMLIKITASPIPEPATMFLLGTGLAGLAGVARRKKVQR